MNEMMSENLKKEIRTKYLWSVVRRWFRLRKFIKNIERK